MYLRLELRWTSYEVRAAVRVRPRLERRRPELVTAAWWKEERGARVFIDFNQNAPHKTIFGAWSVRARPGAQVSTPFAWEELDAIRPDELTIATVPARLTASGDPWAGMARQASIRSSRWRRLTASAASPTRRGRRCIRRCRANLPASPPAGPARSVHDRASPTGGEPDPLAVPLSVLDLAPVVERVDVGRRPRPHASSWPGGPRSSATAATGWPSTTTCPASPARRRRC